MRCVTKFFARAREPSVNQEEEEEDGFGRGDDGARLTARRFDDFSRRRTPGSSRGRSSLFSPQHETRLFFFVVPKRLLLLRATTSDASRDEESGRRREFFEHGFGPADARDGDAS